jgi:hypothetical protein
LHTAKRYEPFTLFRLPDPASPPAGCTLEWENSVGELGLSMLFNDLSPAPDPHAWQGWDGDRYAAWQCSGRRAFVWLTSWDSDGDAQEFADAYRAIAPAVGARAELTAEPQADVHGHEVVLFTPELADYASEVHGKRGTAARSGRSKKRSRLRRSAARLPRTKAQPTRVTRAVPRR